MSSNAPASSMGKVFATVAFIEAATWLGLLVGMYMKYISGTSDAGVWWFGRLHGAAFLLYVVVAFAAGVRLRWPAWALLVALLAAVPPLLTLIVEYWFRRQGLLSEDRHRAAPPQAG